MMPMAHTTWTPRLARLELPLFHTTTRIPNSTMRHLRCLLLQVPKFLDRLDHRMAILPARARARAEAEDAAEEASVLRVVLHELGVIWTVVADDVRMVVVVVEIVGEVALVVGTKVDHGRRTTTDLHSGLIRRSITHGRRILCRRRRYRPKVTVV